MSLAAENVAVTSIASKHCVLSLYTQTDVLAFSFDVANESYTINVSL